MIFKATAMNVSTWRGVGGGAKKVFAPGNEGLLKLFLVKKYINRTSFNQNRTNIICDNDY